MTIAIILPTYKRADGKTFEFLTRALTSIKEQTYQNFKIFLIGDKYEDQSEFEYFATSFFSPEKIKAVNLPYAMERDKYAPGSLELWSTGGVNANNVGLDLAREEGYEYICHLDHDDYWANDHLEQINFVIESRDNPAFIHTYSTYLNDVLPRHSVFDNEIIEAIPIPANLIHSSVCMNIKQLGLRYRDMVAIANQAVPADADLWSRVSQEVLIRQLNSYLIRKLTCYHPIEFTL